MDPTPSPMEEAPKRPPITRKPSRVHDAIADIVSQFDPLKRGDSAGGEAAGATSARPGFEPAAHFKADTEGFDYNQFLHQLRQPGAKSIARNIRNFLNEFTRRPLTLKEQIRVVHDYLGFITQKMADCEVWQGQSEKDFENTKEAMEKLLMNRLYAQTFCPATTDDDEKDKVLHQKIGLFRWIREEHLDIQKTVQNESFLDFAIAELLKMNTFKAPRDKLICILNCCTVIFGLLKHAEGDVGADTFLPVLIYVVIKANPPQLVSNLQFIARFRAPERLQSEAGYYLTNLMGAVSFIESMDASCLSITQDEFDKHIELTIMEMNSEKSRPSPPAAVAATRERRASAGQVSRSTSEPAVSPAEKAALFIERFAQQTMEKPLNFVGRFLSDLAEGDDTSGTQSAIASSVSHQRTASTPAAGSSGSGDGATPPPVPARRPPPATTPVVEIRGDMFPGESAYRELTGREFQANLALLRDMFPNIEPEVCLMILQANRGYVPGTIEALLDIAKSGPTGASALGLDDGLGLADTLAQRGRQDSVTSEQALRGSPEFASPASASRGLHPVSDEPRATEGTIVVDAQLAAQLAASQPFVEKPESVESKESSTRSGSPADQP
ncbi:hypothetical protein IWQ60_002740 [Tieghemiomyces parasiticus]|uniref:VPS9 domain-containing protein n=1 Tax=Tieghemiomyces parasiticus TaxID=78921 RepID=A0A9W8ABK5_9FUNG|nr:hypothetical protein IWQ60_002740 [Tieghemiomyces parasiticus]